MDAVIEANHDIRMLEAGPYPYILKKRILGDRGHLSNEASGRLLRELLNDHIKAIILGHLSKENNFPELAYETVKLVNLRIIHLQMMSGISVYVSLSTMPG